MQFVAALLLVLAGVADAGTVDRRKALLEVQCLPTSNIVVDGKVVGKTRFPFFTNVEIDPGKHRLACEAIMSKKRSPEEELTLGAGETKVIRIRVQ